MKDGAVVEFAEWGERVVVLTRQDCHLCEEAIAQVAAICAEIGEAYGVVDVDSDPELQRRYTDQVPVTFVDGAQHDFGGWTRHGSELLYSGLAEPDAVQRCDTAWSHRRSSELHIPTLGRSYAPRSDPDSPRPASSR